MGDTNRVHQDAERTKEAAVTNRTRSVHPRPLDGVLANYSRYFA